MNSQYVLHRCMGALLLLLSLGVMSSCSLDDELDECCESVTLHYRYVRQDLNDEFRSFIKEMRHFLFDGEGRFLRELPNPSNRQDLHIGNLSEGDYSVITIANATQANTTLSQLAASGSTLSEFQLTLNHLLSAETYGNGDELFWNTRKVSVVRNQRRHYICDLSNIHCHLFVRVKWHSLPKHTGDYTMRLMQVPVGYRLEPTLADTLVIRGDGSTDFQSSESRVVHTFPAFNGNFQSHERVVPLYNLELEGEFVTLRYSDDHIPVLQIFFGDEAITKPLDLLKAFRAWSWYPNRHPEQIYKIDITIYDDGRVVLNQWAEATVMDWIDGGAVGTIR